MENRINKETGIMTTVNMKGRIAARKVARELTKEEMELTAGGSTSTFQNDYAGGSTWDTDCEL